MRKPKNIREENTSLLKYSQIAFKLRNIRSEIVLKKHYTYHVATVENLNTLHGFCVHLSEKVHLMETEEDFVKIYRDSIDDFKFKETVMKFFVSDWFAIVAKTVLPHKAEYLIRLFNREVDNYPDYSFLYQRIFN